MLPLARSPLVGRRGELGVLAELIDGHRVVTVVGVGGVGKTVTALEAARRWLDGHPGWRGLFVDLAPCTADHQVVAGFADSVGMRGAAVGEGLDGVVEALSAEPMLLVVDNCEQVVQGAGQVCDELVRRVGALRVLATSRAPLDIDGECVWPLRPMSTIGDGVNVPVDGDALSLFLDRAAHAGGPITPAEGETPAMAEICRLAGGLPLAIELAATRMRVSTAKEILDGLAGSAWPGRTADRGRHGSLDACLAWSEALLSPGAVVLLRRVSVFPAWFDARAVEAVVATEPVLPADVASLLAELVSASLLEADTSGPRSRYRLPVPVRQYALARLSETGEGPSMRWRHARAFLTHAESVEPGLFEPNAYPLLDDLELYRSDHDAAFAWLLDRGAAEEAQRLAAALYFFWYTRGLFVSGLAWLRAALAAGPTPDRVGARAHLALAQLSFIAGDYLASIVAIEQAVPSARALADDVVLARALALAGYVWWLVDPERSAALFREGLEHADRAGDGFSRCTALAGLGWARYFVDDLDSAEQVLAEATSRASSDARDQQLGMAVLGRAAVELRFGQVKAARASASEALAALETVGDAPWTSIALALLAEIERTCGSLADAERHARQAAAVAERAGSAINVMFGTGHLGRILLACGDPGAAYALDTAVTLARGFGIKPVTAWWLDSLGELAEIQGREDEARRFFEEAIDHARAASVAVDQARSQHHLARLVLASGDIGSALNGCHDALAIQLRMSDPLGLLETLETLGAVLTDNGRAELGLVLLAAARAARDTAGVPPRPIDVRRLEGWTTNARTALGGAADAVWAKGAGMSVEAAASMARRGRGPRRRPSSGWESLTAVELDVAHLVADGLTNPQIASQLSIAAGTAKDHVSSVLRKLGLSTRAQLAAAITARRN